MLPQAWRIRAPVFLRVSNRAMRQNRDMVAIVALAALSYALPVDRPLVYRLEVGLDGFIPILGGQEGSATVDLKVRVEGLKPDGKGLAGASSEIVEAVIAFNGAPLPLGVEAVREYFPKTTVRFTSRGEIKATDAPDVRLPVRLPGLDVKRFPDISYLPVVFPETAPATGGSWTFRKAFGDSEVTYVCTLRKDEGGLATIGVRIDQTYEALENAALEVVSDEKDAFAKVRTVVTGEGEAAFDHKLGAFRSSSIVASAVSDVVEIASGKTARRTLKTTVKLKLLEPDATQARSEETKR